LKVGSSGLVALDWWNGNRSILMNGGLSGVIAGLTLQTRPAEIYRALLESTAFGTRKIVEAFANGGCLINKLIACGGIAHKSPLLLQIYSDVLNLPIEVAASDQASALGSAVLAASAAGIHPSPEAAAAAMVAKPIKTYRPNKKTREAYQPLYQIYSSLHDLLGRQHPSLLTQLRSSRSS
jgi:L-ribulokinase